MDGSFGTPTRGVIPIGTDIGGVRNLGWGKWQLYDMSRDGIHWVVKGHDLLAAVDGRPWWVMFLVDMPGRILRGGN